MVHAVHEERIDAGTVSTGVLEELANKGAIRLEDYRILNPQREDGFPFLLSTQLYPEWAFATLRHTPETLANEVAVALLKLPKDHPAVIAAHTAGWTVPLDYQPVHEALKDLRYGPYANYGEITWRDVLRGYWHVILGILLAVALMIVVTSYVLRLNGKLGREMTERIERTKQIRAILDNVVFGFLRIDKDLVVKDGFTRSCHALFGTEDIANRNLCDLLHVEKSGARAQFQLNAGQVFEDVLPEEVNVAQVPHRFVMPNGCVLNLEARVVRDDDGKVTALLMTISDVTQLEAAQRENEDNRALLNILRQKASFEAFVNETKEQLRSAHVAIGAADVAHVRRVAHTIKGNAASYGVVQLARLIHQIEEQPTIEREHIEVITRALRQFLETHKSVLGMTLEDEIRRSFVVSEAQIEKLYQLAARFDAAHRVELEHVLHELSLTPAAELLGPVQTLAEILASKLGKDVDVKLTGSEVRLDAARLSPVFHNLPHILRNALDHGIEMPCERGDKPARAVLSISMSESPSEYIVTVEDDGRGIDVDAVERSALDKGVITPEEAASLSRDDKLMLIFKDSVSTAAEVTEISGRGVGMAAVLADIKRAGGDVRVHTQCGVGTRFELIVPKRADAPARGRDSRSPPKRITARPPKANRTVGAS